MLLLRVSSIQYTIYMRIEQYTIQVLYPIQVQVHKCYYYECRVYNIQYTCVQSSIQYRYFILYRYKCIYMRIEQYTIQVLYPIQVQVHKCYYYECRVYNIQYTCVQSSIQYRYFILYRYKCINVIITSVEYTIYNIHAYRVVYNIGTLSYIGTSA